MGKMFYTYALYFILAAMAGSTSSCKNNKIPCPTYADSFPDKKKKKKNKPDIPKPTKPKSGVLPPNYKG